MIERSRLKEQLYLAAVIALLLLMSVMNGALTVAIGALLLAVGLLIYPNMRRTAMVSAFVAAGLAVVVVLLRAVFA